MDQELHNELIRLHEKMDKVLEMEWRINSQHEALYGNGHIGLIRKVDALQTSVMLWRWIFGSCFMACASAIALVIVDKIWGIKA